MHSRLRCQREIARKNFDHFQLRKSERDAKKTEWTRKAGGDKLFGALLIFRCTILLVLLEERGISIR